jgi:predicted Zn finger-like uncharacterized protein
MKLSCPSCQARYVIADEKVQGRVVKIRCRRCGAIVVAREAAPQDAGALATVAALGSGRPGERNEQSVLFSLAALGRASAPAGAASASTEASALIDLQLLSRARPRPPERPEPSDAVAYLGCGGVFGSPLLRVEPDVASHVVAPRERGRRAWPAVALVLVVAAGSVPWLRRASVPAAPAEATPSVSSAASSEAVTRGAAEADGGAARVAETKPSSTASDRPVTLAGSPPPVNRRAAVAPSASSRVVESASPCCAGETETACAMRRAVGIACGRPVRETAATFDGAAVARVLGAVDLRRCGRADAPATAGHARVTLEPGGAVSDVVVDTPDLAGTATARCVEQALRPVRVPAFAGSAITVGKRFVTGGGP